MDALLGQAIPALEEAMRFRVARQGVLAANLANVDTPGYRRSELHFESELERAGVRLQRTHPEHQPQGPVPYRLETGPRGSGPDRNGVVLEREVVEVSRNAGAFTDQAAVLSRLMAITRVAVVGEAR